MSLIVSNKTFIAPEIPKKATKWNHTDQASKYRARAKELRQALEHITTAETRDDILKLADQYDRLAERLERPIIGTSPKRE